MKVIDKQCFEELQQCIEKNDVHKATEIFDMFGTKVDGGVVEVSDWSGSAFKVYEITLEDGTKKHYEYYYLFATGEGEVEDDYDEVFEVTPVEKRIIEYKRI